MKKVLVIAAMAGLLLTGCGTAEKPEQYWHLKANCIVNGHESVKEGTNPLAKTWKQLDEGCGKAANIFINQESK